VCRFVGSLGTIIVKCKDLRVIQLDIPGMEECLNIASSIEVRLHLYSLIKSKSNLLSFLAHCMAIKKKKKRNTVPSGNNGNTFMKTKKRQH